MKIAPIKAFTDNYIWAMYTNEHCVVVDPGDARPVMQFLKEHQLTLSAVLITHHHPDHTGGIKALTQAFPELPVFGPNNPSIDGITQPLQEQDVVYLNELQLECFIMEAPGHTLDHIMFYTKGILFCGDTLFSVGCGRLFEGTPQQMTETLNKITRLPDDTMLYGTHEYTQANIEFALAVEPNNEYLKQYKLWVERQIYNNKPTLPTMLKEQLKLNPFLRLNEKNVKLYADEFAQNFLKDSVQVFAALRQAKDEF